jgi:hypothetical protein
LLGLAKSCQTKGEAEKKNDPEQTSETGNHRGIDVWRARRDSNLRRSAGVSGTSIASEREPAAEILSAAKDLNHKID